MTSIKKSQQVTRAVNMVRAGTHLPVDAARECGVGCGVVRERCNKAGVTWPKFGRIGPEIRNRVVRMVHGGYSQQAAAKACGITMETAAKFLLAAGIQTHKHPPIDEARVVRLRRSGLTQEAIAAACGVSVGRVVTVLRRHGLCQTMAERNRRTQRGRAMARAGVHPKEIAGRLGVRLDTANRYYWHQGLRVPCGEREQPDRVPNSVIIREVRDGFAYRVVARRHGITVGTVSGVVHRHRKQQQEARHAQ